MYKYEFAQLPEEKDKVFEFDDVKICIDIKSYLFLNGMEIDYEEDLLKSGLVFNTPSAKRTCRCGESVAF
jgi:iron-sulfur cluster assembly protein